MCVVVVVQHGCVLFSFQLIGWHNLDWRRWRRDNIVWCHHLDERARLTECLFKEKWKNKKNAEPTGRQRNRVEEGEEVEEESGSRVVDEKEKRNTVDIYVFFFKALGSCFLSAGSASASIWYFISSVDCGIDIYPSYPDRNNPLSLALSHWIFLEKKKNGTVLMAAAKSIIFCSFPLAGQWKKRPANRCPFPIRTREFYFASSYRIKRLAPIYPELL